MLMLQWIDPDTNKRKSKSAGTADEREAAQARADLEYELNKGLHKEASRMTWEKFRGLFEAKYVANLRQQTRRNYADTFNLFEELCHPAGLRSITERTVSRFASAMRQRPTRGRIGMMLSSVHVRLEFLHTALAWAVEPKILPACPKFPTIKVPRKRPQPVPAESFEKLLEKATDAQTQAYLLAGWLGGLRLREALALDWEPTNEAPRVDLSRDRIIFSAECVKAVEDQWVPFDPILREAMEALPHHGRKAFRFISRKTGEPVCAEGMSQRIIKLAKLAGVKLSMHSLRKGFGCHYAGKVPAQVLQRLMRHANIGTTMGFYANVDAAVEEAVLGAKRNTSRNSRVERQEVASESGDVNTCAHATL